MEQLLAIGILLALMGGLTWGLAKGWSGVAAGLLLWAVSALAAWAAFMAQGASL